MGDQSGQENPAPMQQQEANPSERSKPTLGAHQQYESHWDDEPCRPNQGRQSSLSLQPGDTGNERDDENSHRCTNSPVPGQTQRAMLPFALQFIG